MALCRQAGSQTTGRPTRLKSLPYRTAAPPSSPLQWSRDSRETRAGDTVLHLMHTAVSLRRLAFAAISSALHARAISTSSRALGRCEDAGSG